MPYDSNGNYSLPPQYFVQLGDDVLPSQHNPPFEDVRNALSSVLVKDGRAAMTGPLDMGGYTMGNLADGVNPQDAATVAQAAYAIGDFKDSARDLGAKWLRRDGSLYASALYPDLAAVLPSLPDGVTWTNTNAITSGTVRRVVKTSTGFLMMVDDGSANSKVFTTDNAAAVWSQVATISGFRVYDFELQAGVYVAVDQNGKVSVSNDGATWSAPVTILSFTGIGGVRFAFGLFVAVGDGGKIATSPDGVTWTSRTSGVSQFLFKVVLTNGVLLALGASGTLLSSTDGINWTIRTTGVSQTLYDATHDGTQYVVVGSAGTIITSTNLTTWTPRTSGTTQSLNGVVRSPSGLLAAGSSGAVRISANGTTWEASATGTSVDFFTVSFDPNNTAKYFVGGNGALYTGIRTLPSQFATPDDNPEYGWIRALA